MSDLAPGGVLMVRPHAFAPNPLTALDNAFQSEPACGARAVARRARDEVTRLADALTDRGIEVTLHEDRGALTPDSVFPNNWLSMHEDGTLVLYPMCAANRRAERRADIVADLQSRFAVRRVLDHSLAERDGDFLEGTGAMVLDHRGRIAFGCRSRRLSARVLAEVCHEIGCTPLLFDADDGGIPVYHTNVLMSVGTHSALIGSSLIRDAHCRREVLDVLRVPGRTVVELDEAQVRAFAGNCLELQGTDGPLLAMSRTARRSLRADQVRALEASVRLLVAAVPTIETAGGSVRCMLAANPLPARRREVVVPVEDPRTGSDPRTQHATAGRVPAAA